MVLVRVDYVGVGEGECREAASYDGFGSKPKL